MAAITPDVLYKAWKAVIIAIGGGIGWFVAEFSPTFPLIVVAVVFILYDAYTAYELDKRVHKMYPEKKKREKAHFTSFAFGKVLRETIPKRLWLIFLAYLVEHWVFIHVSIPLSYIITGAICFEQAWSILENESSCRGKNESRFWKMLQRIMIDKTERHFDVTLEELKGGVMVTDEQIESLRAFLKEHEEANHPPENQDSEFSS